MGPRGVTRWAQRSVAAGAGFLVAWHLAAVADAPRGTLVALALQGFVLHVVFGKAYSLVPSYFDRNFELAAVPIGQVPLTVTGTTLLAAGPWLAAPAIASTGAVLWTAGVAAFVAGMLWTVRGNVTGADTATSDANADRRRTDRVANAFVPVAFAYLLAGTYATARFDYAPRATHLLAAGFAALLLFALGFRLLPRFMVATPPRGAVWLVLPAGAVGPLLIAVGVPAGSVLAVGALVESAAVVGFAGTLAALYRRSDRDRVGFYGVLAGAAAGAAAAALGGWMAVAASAPGVARAHFRLNLLGLLGLSIVGVAYQFYPPAVGSNRLATDRTAFASIAALACGLTAQTCGLLLGHALLVTAGEAAGAVGALLFAALIVGLLAERGEL